MNPERVLKYKNCFFYFLITCSLNLMGQNLYFPPKTGNEWQSISIESLNWSAEKLDTLYNFLEEKNTKAFIVLKDGKIVIEKYFETFEQDSNWYWASAGKTLTAFMAGIAQEEGFLSITDSSSKYLGNGWTSCPPEKERQITILNQLTMTSGLNDNVIDPYCTEPSCLEYEADAGTRWAYHNAPYTLLDGVLENAAGQNLNIYFNSKIRSRIGMNGLWVASGYNNIYISTARSMAKFGILIQNKGIWETDTLLKDESYFNSMINTSQSLNKSYGYLWWLAGKESYMLPRTQAVISGTWAPAAPPDMIAALGKNGQILNVVPSLGIVLVRMGEAPDSSVEVAPYFNNQIWQKFSEVIDYSTTIEKNTTKEFDFSLEQNYPNPFNPTTTIKFRIPLNSPLYQRGETGGLVTLKIFDILGREVTTLVNQHKPAGNYEVKFDAGNLASGVYLYKLQAGEFSSVKKLMLLK